MFRLRSSVVCLFVIALSGASYANVLLDRVVAVVNQDVITWSELYRAMETDASPQLKEMKEEERRKVFKENEASFLENLINVKLQLQEAKSLGITASEDDIKESIDGIVKKYSMTDASFKESLKKEGYTFDEYRKRLQEQIIISKVVNQLIRSKILVSGSDIKKFIENNKNITDNAEGYRISQIFLKKPVNDADRGRVEEKASAIMAELKSGGNFADLAKKYSEDPSAGAGGSLGFIKKGDLMKEFGEAAAGLKPDEISAPFWTDKGLHIIRLDEKTAANTQSEIEEKAKKSVENKIFLEKYNAWVKSLRERAFIEVRL